MRQGDAGAALDALGAKYGSGPSAAALDSMLSNDICQEHVRLSKQQLGQPLNAGAPNAYTLTMHAPPTCMQMLSPLKFIGGCLALTPCTCNEDFHMHRQVEELEAQVSGEFPAWLDGTLIRNGPGTFKVHRLWQKLHSCCSCL